jgi:DMSO/TMAO reductase YedYZ molybdopterin-dependent catalytic subunit
MTRDDRLGHEAERAGLDRRRFLATGGTMLAAIVTGCNSRGPKSAQEALEATEAFNERIETKLFRHTAINDPKATAIEAGNKFRAYFISDSVPLWDAATNGAWRLEVGGLVDRPLKLSLEELMRLPSMTHRMDHFCVEGWTAVARRTGVRVSDLARLAGVKPDAQFVDFESFDAGYHESWDLASAMHPQTLVVYGQDGQPLSSAYGAPARVFSPVKLGYKNTKYLTRIMFLPRKTGGYWSDQGYEWFGGT